MKKIFYVSIVIFCLAAAAFAQDINSLFDMGEALFEKGDYRNAALYFEQGLVLVKTKAPDENVPIARIHLRIGQCYMAMNNYNNALFNFYEALDRAKRGIVVDRNGASAIMFGAYGSILDVYDQEGLTGPMLDVTDEFIAFIEEYNKSPLPEEVLPKAGVNNFLAYCWAQKGQRLDEALVLIEESLKSEPKSAAFLDTKGWVLLKMGKIEEAKKVLSKALDLCKKGEDSCFVIERHLKLATEQGR